jgi:acyl-CoA synthetase (AMP-forming)/AMP-acid ligase II
MSWSRRGLRQAVVAAAGQLSARSRPGDRIVVSHPPGPAFVAAFLGCLVSGRIAVPAAAPLTTASRAAVARIAQASGATLTLSGGASFDEPAHGGDFIAPASDDIAYLQFTSGSTAAPRGAVITHRALRANLAAIGDAWRLSQEDRGVFWLPPFHDMGLVGAIMAPVAFSIPSTLMHPAAFLQRPERWLSLMTSRRGTFSGGPNFAYDLAAERVRDEECRALDLSAWRVAVNGAEPVRRATLRRFCERFANSGFRRDAFAPGYGLAESVLFVSARRPGDPCALEGRDHDPVDCGAPGAGIDVAVVDEATRAAAPAGETGAIWISGDTVADGYWRSAEDETFAARLHGDPRRWLRTGDLGAMREGRLFIVGRAKGTLLRNGRTYHAADIEHLAVQALGRRASVAAFAAPDGDAREIIVVLVEGSCGDADRALAAVRDAIADGFDLAPDLVALVPPGSVRLTTSGKVARAATAEAWRGGAIKARAIWKRPHASA